MGTAFTPAKTSPGSWDAFSDVDAFVDAVLVELASMAVDGTRSTRSGPRPPSTGAALRRAIMAIWCVCFCGIGPGQWTPAAVVTWRSAEPEMARMLDAAFALELRLERKVMAADEDLVREMRAEMDAATAAMKAQR
jgi:hypothetical protein